MNKLVQNMISLLGHSGAFGRGSSELVVETSAGIELVLDIAGDVGAVPAHLPESDIKAAARKRVSPIDRALDRLGGERTKERRLHVSELFMLF